MLRAGASCFFFKGQRRFAVRNVVDIAAQGKGIERIPVLRRVKLVDCGVSIA